MVISYSDARRTPVRTSAEVEARVVDLVGPALVRKIWLLFLDEEGIQLPLLIPIVNLPRRAPHVAPFNRALAELQDLAHSVIVVYERPGPPALSDNDRAWLRVLHEGVRHTAFTLGGILLSHTSGVRWLSRDDWS